MTTTDVRMALDMIRRPKTWFAICRFYYRLDTRWSFRVDGACPSCGRRGVWNHAEGCETQRHNSEMLMALCTDPKERRAV